MNRFLLFVLILTLSGCQFLGSSQAGQIEDIAAVIYSGGDGLTMEFSQNAPPDTVLSKADVQVPVILRIDNVGAVSVDAEAVFLGFAVDQNVFKELTQTFPVSLTQLQGVSMDGDVLEGKEDQRAGDVALVEIPLLIKAAQERAGTSTIVANLCYSYETHASVGVCIETARAGVSTPDACEQKPVTLKDQGAPIAVTRVEPLSSLISGEDGQKYVQPHFKIYFENVGPGTVVDPRGSIEDTLRRTCDSRVVDDPELRTKFNTLVLASAFFGEDIKLECEGTPPSESFSVAHISEFKDDQFFFCSVSKEDAIKHFSAGTGGFVRNLEVNLRYGYTQARSKTVALEPFT